MSKHNDYPWIVIGDEEKNPGICLRCGKRLNVILPQALSVWVAALNAFIAIHKHCPVPAEKQTSRSVRT